MLGPGFVTTYCGSAGIVFFILIIAILLLYFLKNRRKGQTRIHSDQEPLEQLKLRLVRGEITTEEYQRVKEVLTK